jgi:hypothetical protein
LHKILHLQLHIKDGKGSHNNCIMLVQKLRVIHTNEVYINFILLQHDIS